MGGGGVGGKMYLVGDRMTVQVDKRKFYVLGGDHEIQEDDKMTDTVPTGTRFVRLGKDPHLSPFHFTLKSAGKGRLQKFNVKVIGKAGLEVDGKNIPKGEQVAVTVGQTLSIGGWKMTVQKELPYSKEDSAEIPFSSQYVARSMADEEERTRHKTMNLRKRRLISNLDPGNYRLPANAQLDLKDSGHGMVEFRTEEVQTAPKTKRGGRAKKYSVIPKDKDGNPILPIEIGMMRILCLGKIITDRPGFHSKRYIWPVGFRSSRLYPSTLDPRRKVLYISEIREGPAEPLFVVIPEDADSVEGATATAAWHHIVKAVNDQKEDQEGRRVTTAVSGPEMFGYSHPTIANLIQQLPGASQCRNYKFRHLEATNKSNRIYSAKYFSEESDES